MSNKTPIALIGLGGVGHSILTQLLSQPLSSKFHIAIIANSKKYLAVASGSTLTLENYKDELNKKGQDLDVPTIISKLSTSRDGPGIFVDSTASETISALYPMILQMNVNIVTPNKKATSSSLQLYQSIISSSEKSGTSYYGESTVGAGLPILSTLKDLVNTGDQVEKIEGVFSGTLSYIFNEFSKADAGEKEVKFSDVVKVAKENGYTVSYLFSDPKPRRGL